MTAKPDPKTRSTSNCVTIWTESILDDSALRAIEENIDKFPPQELEDFFNSKNNT